MATTAAPKSITALFRCAHVQEGDTRDKLLLRPVESDEADVNDFANQNIPYGEVRLGLDVEKYRGLITPGTEVELTIRPTAE